MMHKFKRGFTLIELMVTIGIFVFMTALLLAKYNSFGADTILTNMAYDVALTIRQAQTYGLSVKTTGNSDFSKAYGVHFDTGSGAFVLFMDSDPSAKRDGIYTSGKGEEITTYNLKQGAKISEMCVDQKGKLECKDASGTPFNPTILDITFLRPDPKAVICTNGGKLPCDNEYAEITISSADGVNKRKVIVTRMGQISVKVTQ